MPGQALSCPSLDAVFLGELGDACRDVGEQGAAELPVTPPGEAISENQIRMYGLGLAFLSLKLLNHAQEQQDRAKLDKREHFPVVDSAENRPWDC